MIDVWTTHEFNPAHRVSIQIVERETDTEYWVLRESLSWSSSICWVKCRSLEDAKAFYTRKIL